MVKKAKNVLVLLLKIGILGVHRLGMNRLG